MVQIGELQLLYKSQAVQIQEGDDEQSTVFAAIDMTTPSDRLYPIVKPEEKLRALQQISQAFGTTLVLSELLDKVLGIALRHLPARRARIRPARGQRAQGARPGGDPDPEPGPRASCRSASRSSSGCSKTARRSSARTSPAEFPKSESVYRKPHPLAHVRADHGPEAAAPSAIIQIDTGDGRGRFEPGRPRPAGRGRQPDQRGGPERPAPPRPAQAARARAGAAVRPPGHAGPAPGAPEPRSRATSSGTTTSRPATSGATTTGSSRSSSPRTTAAATPGGGRSPWATWSARGCPPRS